MIASSLVPAGLRSFFSVAVRFVVRYGNYSKCERGESNSSRGFFDSLRSGMNALSALGNGCLCPWLSNIVGLGISALLSLLLSVFLLYRRNCRAPNFSTSGCGIGKDGVLAIAAYAKTSLIWYCQLEEAGGAAS